MRKTMMLTALVAGLMGASALTPASAGMRCDCQEMQAPPAPPAPPGPPMGFQAPYPPPPPGGPNVFFMRDRDGEEHEKVSKDDFVEHAEEAFDRMDRNHDGYLSEDERPPRPPLPPAPPGFAPRAR